MSVVAMGELVIDFVAQESGVPLADVSGFLKKAGGAPANVAVAVARLGRQSAFLGQVGDDAFGHYLKQVLADENVNVSGLRITDAARTMLAFVWLGDEGERDFMFYRNPSADMLMQPGDVATDVIDNGAIFHFGSITMITDPAKQATLHAVRHAQKQGKFISYDPNWRPPLWESDEAAREGMLEGFPYANVAKLSEDEYEFLLPDGDIERIWHDNMQCLIVTYGGQGAMLYTRSGEQHHHSGYRVQPVDTTGAGDAFVAGMLVNILEQRDQHAGEIRYFEDVLRFANAAGALTTTQKGAISSLPNREELESFIRHQHP